MPNHVTNKISFEATHAEHVFSSVCTEGLLDFNKLIPKPPHIYRGSLSSEDEKDFTCNWLDWSNENWGTKWSAYNGSCNVVDGMAVITFDTAWSVPYPVLSAFSNRFNVPFEHRYFDEGHGFWGIETWKSVDGIVKRTGKRKSNLEDKKALCVELKGYDPDINNEED